MVDIVRYVGRTRQLLSCHQIVQLLLRERQGESKAQGDTDDHQRDAEGDETEFHALKIHHFAIIPIIEMAASKTGRGLPVSLGGFLEYRLLQRQVSHDPPSSLPGAGTVHVLCTCA